MIAERVVSQGWRRPAVLAVASKRLGDGRELAVYPSIGGGGTLCLESESGGGRVIDERWDYDAVGRALAELSLFDPRDDEDGPSGWTRHARRIRPDRDRGMAPRLQDGGRGRLDRRRRPLRRRRIVDTPRT